MKQDIKKEQKVISRTKDYSLKTPDETLEEGLSVDLEGSAEILSFLDDLENRMLSAINMIRNLKENIENKYDSSDEKYVEDIVDKTVSLAVKTEYSVVVEQRLMQFLDRIRTKNAFEKDETADDFNDEITTSSIKFYVGTEPVFYYFRLPALSKIYSEKNSSQINMLGDSVKISVRRIASQIVLSDKFTHVFDKFTIIFVHHIIPNTYQGDTDNFNIKKPIDGINGLLIRNDSSSRSHIYQITQIDDIEYTEMYVIEGHEISDELMGKIDGKFEVEI